jgi:hypothetical protein
VTEGRPQIQAHRPFEAGVELLIVSSPQQQQADAYHAVVAAVESGEIAGPEVCRARIRVKEKYALGGAGRH